MSFKEWNRPGDPQQPRQPGVQPPQGSMKQPQEDPLKPRSGKPASKDNPHSGADPSAKRSSR